jgi:hypothetical protein
MALFSKGQLITGGIAAAGVLIDLLTGDNKAKGSSTTEYLWKFVEHESIYSSKRQDESNRKLGYGPAPDLVGVNQPTGVTSTKNIDHIDVINSFPWTVSPKTARHDVPSLMLREKKIQVNPQINQIANNLYVAAEKGGRATEQIKEMLPSALKEQIANNKVTAENELGAKILSGAKKAKELGSQLASGAGVMSPYEQLYYTKDTGFVYTLPYTDTTFKTTTNSFTDSGSDNSKLLSMVGQGAKIAAAMATSFNIADPGTYIENPKFYDFGGREQKSYTCTFPLINTASFNDVVRNWQLIFLLIYQNTPNRLTRDLIDPPCIYEANLDGTWYSKYAYIEKVDVQFAGATRRMTLPIPTEVTADGSGDSSNKAFPVATIIPDAYNVTVTVREIFSETQNFLFQSINQDNKLVTTQRKTVESNVTGVVDSIASATGLDL